MNVSFLTVFPQLYDQFLQTSIVGRASEQGKVRFELVNYFSFCPPKQRVDAPAFGHGAGMVMRPEMVGAAIDDTENRLGKAYKLFFSPQGKKLDQYLLRSIAHEAEKAGHLMLVTSRYEGMDARVEEEYADLVVSLGDYVLMGGDLPAMVLTEGLLRLIPGVIGKAASVAHESFSGPLFDYPAYCSPVVWKNREVPEIIRSGNHAAMDAWRRDQAIRKTVIHNFEWLSSHELKPQEREEVLNVLPNHYAVLMHTQVMLPDNKVGTTSVTSMDIHDIARSGRTFGIKNYFIVTPLKDQQQVVQTLLDFWLEGGGVTYNQHRHEALKRVRMLSSFDEVLAAIEQLEGSKPIILAVESDRMVGNRITYNEQGVVWALKKPVLFLFGTGKGLSQDLVDRADFVLDPIDGLTDFNHLSVRSAVAIVFDRWLGLHYKRH
jgi:tRNA (guanine37-N1)-methyltransferase